MAKLGALVAPARELKAGVISKNMGNGMAEVVVSGQKYTAMMASEDAKTGTRCLVAMTGAGAVAIAGISGSGGGGRSKVVMNG